MDLRNEGEPTIADEGGRERPRTQLTTGTEITGVRPFRKPILTAATQTCLMPHKVEDAPLKPVYTLVFVLSTFAAPAQALDASTIAAWELDECSWEVIAQSTMPAPMVASEPTIGMLEETDDAAITGPNDAEGGIAVGTIQPSEAQGTMPAQIVDDEADDVVITGANGAEDILVGATQGGDETPARAAQMVAGEPTIDELAEAVDAAVGISHGRAPPPRD